MKNLYGLICWTIVLLLVVALGTACSSQNTEPVTADPPPTHETTDTEELAQHYRVVLAKNHTYLPLAELKSVVNEEGWTVRWKPGDRQLTIERNERYLRLTAGIPVVERNGHYEALTAPPVYDEPEGLLVPVSLLEQSFGWEAKEATRTNPHTGELQLSVRVDSSSTSLEEWPLEGELPQTREELVSYLSFLQTPIKGAKPRFADGHVPGADRGYRNGTHEGFDWYGYRIGVTITRRTPVRAMGPGRIIRADHGWKTPTTEERNKWLKTAAEAAATPAWVLDRLRGRQVWIMHSKGVMIRYAHLSGIPPNITVGTTVDPGATIGFVGNSGTSAEAAGTAEGLHLHSDILVYGQNVWLPFEPQTLREMMARILGDTTETTTP